MANLPNLLHGWKIQYLEHPSPDKEPNSNRRKPYVLLTKGKEWVKTRGRPGTDYEVLMQRGMKEALMKDILLASTPKEREVAELAWRRMDIEERVAMTDRMERTHGVGNS